jgi:hypothetical protein
MATKKTKAPRKTSAAGTVRDLTTRKDPRGGAQKKEGPDQIDITRGTLPSRAGKTRLS